MEKRIYTVAVDLGTSNIVVIAGSKNPDGTVHIEKVVSKPSEGINAGEIENIASAGNTIRAAIDEMSQALGVRINEVYTGISGHFMRCESYTDHVFTMDSQSGVSQHDVDALFARMDNVQAPKDEVIMERIPQNYVLDDNREVKNPVGSFGRRLSATFKFILCESTPLERLNLVFDRLGITVLGVYPSMLTTAEVVTMPDEKDEGVAVVDLGGGKTDVTVIHKGVVRYAASLPIGGIVVNNDICTLGIPERAVELLKVKHGSAMPELVERRKLLKINGSPRQAKEILAFNLAKVIEARMMDITDMVKNELRDSGYFLKLGYGIVLTGGGERMLNVAELFRRELGLDVRLSTIDLLNKNDNENKPAYATALGLLMRGLSDGRSSIEANIQPATVAQGGSNSNQPTQRPTTGTTAGSTTNTAGGGSASGAGQTAGGGATPYGGVRRIRGGNDDGGMISGGDNRNEVIGGTNGGSVSGGNTNGGESGGDGNDNGGDAPKPKSKMFSGWSERFKSLINGAFNADDEPDEVL